jgi:hypothetical protein
MGRGPTLDRPDAASQLLLMHAWRGLVSRGDPLPSLREVGFQAYSQADEDGILLYLFALCGMQSRRCVEICAGAGEQSNSANLILAHGWHGLLVEGDAYLVERGRRFFARHPASRPFPPVYARAWVTRDSVNELVESNGFGGEIDLLSLDLDGVDYWIWEALTACRPRVVVVEYQELLGPEARLTVPYSDAFDGYAQSVTRGMPNFAGASLAAYVALGRRKGYRLVGCNRLCFNAFFVRDDVAPDLLPEVPAQACFGHPKAQQSIRERYPLVAHLDWQQV